PKVARTGEILLSPTRMPIRGYVTFLSEILVTTRRYADKSEPCHPSQRHQLSYIHQSVTALQKRQSRPMAGFVAKTKAM
ncbi:hypothetical protein, partial [Burkholderia ubonensis]